jgi:enterochelin esterase-like enzyme
MDPGFASDEPLSTWRAQHYHSKVLFRQAGVDFAGSERDLIVSGRFLMQKSRPFWLIFILVLWLNPCYGKGTLEGPIRIHSKVLGYDLQYWVYLPEDAAKPFPELYVTDGQVYLGSGEMAKVLDREIKEGNIVPVSAIFLDSRDPDFPEENRRHRQFMCNADFARFFVGELMPEVAKKWTGADSSTWRGLMGVSFGGINTACFGIMVPDVFQVLIMQSPASTEHLDVINDLYKQKPQHSSAFLVSHGGASDNEAAARRFVQTLEEKGYPVRHISNDGGHDWDNWAPLIDDSLRAFAGTREEDQIQ